jgi:hypothetical protein
LELFTLTTSKTVIIMLVLQNKHVSITQTTYTREKTGKQKDMDVRRDFFTVQAGQ